MKYLYLLIVLSIGYNASAQNKWDTEERKYTGGVIVWGLIDDDNSKLIGSLQPLGKDVTVLYDPFFNKYTINWTGEEGKNNMVLKFSEENFGGKMYLHVNGNDNPYFINDVISKENKLIIMSAKHELINNRKVRVIFLVSDLK